MTDPSLELQRSLVARLRAPGVLPYGVGVFDDVPEGAGFPYVSLGDGQVLPDKAECVDGAEAFLQIDVWTQTVGYGETKTIAGRIVAALDDQALTVAGFDVVVFELQGAQYMRDPDGRTRHGALTFRAVVTAT